MKSIVITAAAAIALPLLVTGPAGAEPPPGTAQHSGPRGCDPIDPANCLMPFPNDWFTVKDHRSPTGRRVALTVETMPKNAQGKPVDPTEWNRNDGFSPGSVLLTRVPGLDLARSGAAPITDVGRSLERTAPAVLINTRTGRRQPYWTELDVQAPSPDKQTLAIRPASNLEEGARYVVALRNLRDASGGPIPPDPTFAAMLRPHPPRDRALFARWLEMRRVLWDLWRNGVSTSGLFLAWDFTVASAGNITGRAVHMRDEAFAGLGDQTPKVTITGVTDYLPEQDANVQRKVRGTVMVPNYLNQPGGPPGSRLNYGPDGRPEPTGSLEARFACVIPRTATASTPARPALFGHGLFGNEDSVDSGLVRRSAYESNTVFCAAVWTGLSRDDIVWLLGLTSDFSLFPSLPDRFQQSYLNFQYVGRAMIHSGGLAALPEFRDGGGALLDPGRPLVYAGYSLGGIQGTALTALSKDFRRAVLGVPATNFSLLMERSTHFAPFQAIVRNSYPDRFDQAVLLALSQMLFDRGEGNGYVAHITRERLGTPGKQVLLHMAFGDHQVTNYATVNQARTLRIPVHQPALTDGRFPGDMVWSLGAIPSDRYRGSALIVWDSGAAAPPLGNVPNVAGRDPHGDPGATLIARQQAMRFLDTGIIENVCGEGPCLNPLP